MNPRLVDEIANAVLYEGYLLYPYRASALKNRHRFNFGVVVPRDASASDNERWSLRTDCLLHGTLDSPIVIRVRFLHLRRPRGGPAVSSGWDEAVEREVRVEYPVRAVIGKPFQQPFQFDGSALHDAVCGRVDVIGALVGERLIRIRVVVSNFTPVDDTEAIRHAVLKRSLVSTHVILQAPSGGEFVSLLDPPAEFQPAASECEHVGLWPVLAGEEHERDAMLASPIILYDYPQIAPESAGDFFDGTEIDEMLALRILTMTDDEKVQARATDSRARALLERTESLSEGDMMKLHGVLRGLRPLGEAPQ